MNKSLLPGNVESNSREASLWACPAEFELEADFVLRALACQYCCPQVLLCASLCGQQLLKPGQDGAASGEQAVTLTFRILGHPVQITCNSVVSGFRTEGIHSLETNRFTLT